MKKKNKQPLVSVVMTVYNEKQYLSTSLQSILSQTYTNLEIIIVNDASTDTTPVLLEAFAKKDPRIKLFHRKKNTGPCVCSNFAFSKVQGKYIARMDADDIADPARIEKQVAFMEMRKDVVICGTQSSVINEHGKRISSLSYPTDHAAVKDALFMINPILHPTSLYRASTQRAHGIYYKPEYPISNDLLLLFEFLRFGKLANLHEELLQRRVLSTSITHDDPKKSFWEAVAVRHMAVRTMSYRPSLLGVVVHISEILAISLMPSRSIAPVYYRIRNALAKPISERIAEYQALIQSLLKWPARAFFSIF